MGFLRYVHSVDGDWYAPSYEKLTGGRVTMLSKVLQWTGEQLDTFSHVEKTI